MSFGQPAILWWILLLVLPLLLYLLPLPRRVVTASALYLWEKFLLAERFGRTTERFRRAMGFALLAAILLSLIIAAADLTLGSPSTRARRVVVLIDVSASMNAAADGLSNLQRAIEAAAQFIESLDTGAEVAVAETAGDFDVIFPMAPARTDAARRVREIEPFDGPADMRRALSLAWSHFGRVADAEIFVFTDAALPASPWAGRAHAWIAPAADLDNSGIVQLACQRAAGSAGHGGRDVDVSFTLANYGRTPAKLSGLILANGQPRGFFDGVPIDPGQSVRRSVSFEEPGGAAVEVVLKDHHDALGSDDRACAIVPSLEDLRAGIYWPDANRRNEYVSAVLAALQENGSIGSLIENPADPAPVSIYVNQLPVAWPAGGAIVLYPLRSGAIEVAGIHPEPLIAARQVEHELLAGVDLRGLSVKGAVQAKVPQWLRPLIFSEDNVPLIWAGQTGGTKVLLLGIPVMPSGSRLPLVASFPVLVRNAVQWMLPRSEILRPGEQFQGWTRRRAGLGRDSDGRLHAFSLLSAAESDLRRPKAVQGEDFGRRRSLALVCVLIAAILLPLEWGLFHKRMTE